MINDNYTTETLENILFATALEGKFPNNVTSTIKAVDIPIVSKLTVNTSGDLAAAVSKNLLPANQTFIKEIGCGNNFIQAITAEHLRQLLELTKGTYILNSTSQKLEMSNHSFVILTKNIQALAPPDPTPHQLH